MVLLMIYYFYNASNKLMPMLSLRNISTDSLNNKPPIPNNHEIIYEDPINQRETIRLDNNGKVGVYAWVNKINGKVYIGSGDPLYLRISDYYQKWYLQSRTNLYIVRALNKYGMDNFTLIIL